MKKLLFMSILIYSSFNAFAQKEEEKTKPTDKGHLIVDGSVFLSTTNTKYGQDRYSTEISSFSFGISPKAAYFVVDRLALGLETSFNNTNSEFTNTDGTKSSSNSSIIIIGPYARYYLSNGFFGQASVDFGTTKNENETFSSKNDIFRYQLGLGYAIFLNQHISLEPIISYQYSKTSRDQSSFDTINNGFTLAAGFTIYL